MKLPVNKDRVPSADRLFGFNRWRWDLRYSSSVAVPSYYGWPPPDR